MLQDTIQSVYEVVHFVSTLAEIAERDLNSFPGRKCIISEEDRDASLHFGQRSLVYQ